MTNFSWILEDQIRKLQSQGAPAEWYELPPMHGTVIKYRKLGELVFVKGIITTSPNESSHNATVLPVGYRPVEPLSKMICSKSPVAIRSVDIRSDGNIVISGALIPENTRYESIGLCVDNT